MPQVPKSAINQILEGNPNKKNTEELKERAEQEKQLQNIPDKKITPPKFLNDVANKEFKRIVKVLKNVRVLTEADIGLLATYCMAYSKVIEIEEILEREGLMVGEQEHPLIKRQKNYVDQMRTIGTDFGLSPIARSKLAITRTQEKREATAAEKVFGNV
ncbi:phage terminase small subunit P27 family [Bacillus velezensis]|uniref:phage terminase small subunit P27 family n=1 Tax=Bacillus amyloliquefaciens group TaxID=1938374 RepID=UPI00024588B4|nr:MULTISPECIES: phage terminase small subunit P27 family [Bacillus amyloliquefaciens group]ERH55287.1 terminase [Bacillus amyloliquefaciens EGD-AQ14]MDH3087214.1 phage terminase small subunit P27 family [Bacillus velezensis]PKF83676.1 phage terminase small subunit P27 family [Bacillus velezensis]WEY80391.1 phage terminase small subunit P27 family [Bacillus velezensis]WPB65701.1 phage terminase small subunit P27 family [Bacillus velezensis]